MMRSLASSCSWLGSLFVFAVTGCSSQDTTCLDSSGQLDSCEASAATAEWAPALPDSAPLEERLAQVEADLSVGAQGADVRAVHEYLTEFGYFPNAELGSMYARWRPIVGEAPGDPELYDELTLAAVSELQRNHGLVVTGIVDEPTRALLRADRCGLPDGIRRHDPSQKFAQYTQKLTDTTLTWRVVNVNGMNDTNLLPAAPAGCAPATCTAFRTNQVRTAFQGAFAAWERATGVDFTEVGSGTADIQIGFVANTPGIMNAPLPGQVAAGQPLPINVESNKNWSANADTIADANRSDLQTTAMHEIGHLLGLLHSTVTGRSTTAADDAFGATMTSVVSPTNKIDRVLHPDDNVAASPLYDGWLPISTRSGTGVEIGPARDIAVGTNEAWMVGGAAFGGGFTIHARSVIRGSTWSVHATGGQGARRIAVAPNRRPWIINGSGQVMERDSIGTGSGNWILRGTPSNCATDIGIGGASGSGEVWILGCSADSNGNFKVYRWTGSSWNEPDSTARATRITVDGSGVPWAVNSFGDIWRRPLATGIWEQIPGKAIDIGAGPAATALVGGVTTPISYVYVTTSGQNIWAWNEQPQDPADTCTAANCPVSNWSPGAFTFVQSLGAAATIAVGANGDPWAVGSNGTVWAQN